MDMDELERLAKDATPGRWWVQVYQNQKNGKSLCTLETSGDSMDSVADGLYEYDARFIAAADPYAILRLVAIARAAEAVDADATTYMGALPNGIFASLSVLRAALGAKQ